MKAARRQGGKPARSEVEGAAREAVATTLWTAAQDLDAQMLAYTAGDDREWDRRLLRWDILGSLGHLQALRGGRIVSEPEYRRLGRALRSALRAAQNGELTIGSRHEDVHSAVEFWLTQRFGRAGEQIHTGRSRNDQVALDLRLYMKDAVLTLHRQATNTIQALLAFARQHRAVLWPGYTHQRRAMPSSGGLWAAAYAEGLLDTLDGVNGFWRQLNRSPLGSAAGYGVPLPLARERAAQALGFADLDQVVTSVQNSRGKLEAAVLFWCAQLGSDLAKLSADVIFFSAEEFGWLVLPPALATGSSIMPQKRNPDLFELTRARAATVEGALAETLALRAKLTGGYHRDFQLLKAPLGRGLAVTGEMLAMIAAAVPMLTVNRDRGSAGVQGDVLATDEVMRRVRKGQSFRQAYREVAVGLKRGEAMPPLSAKAITSARTSTGALGNLRLDLLVKRLKAQERWQVGERKRFEAALAKLTRSAGT